MKRFFFLILTALLFLAFSPVDAMAREYRSYHSSDRHGSDRYHSDRSGSDHRDRGHHYGSSRHGRYQKRKRYVYRKGHYTIVKHRRVWIPARRIVVYY